MIHFLEQLVLHDENTDDDTSQLKVINTHTFLEDDYLYTPINHTF